MLWSQTQHSFSKPKPAKKIKQIFDRIVVSQASLVAHVVECFHNRNTRLEDAYRHLRFKVSAVPKFLNVLAKQAVEWLVARSRHAMLLAENAQIFDNEGMQSIESSRRLIFGDSFAHLLGESFKVSSVRGGD
jgi:hypothetical protein